MEPVVIYPDPKYRTKLAIVVTLFILAVFSWWTIPLAYAAGYGMAEGGGAILGLAFTALINGGAVAIALAFVPAYYRSIRYEIHPDEVVVHIGIVTKTVKHVPYRTVTNLEVTRGPFDRMFGIGSLKIQTAGMSGQTGAEEKLEGLVDVQAIYEKVAGELRRFRSAMAPTQAGEEAAPAPASGDGQLLAAILDELRALRAGLERTET